MAKSPSQGSCSGGAIAPGVYNGLTVTGDCTITEAVTINGRVTVGKGVDLEAAFLGTRLTVNGDVKVGQGATLGLGCAFGFHDRGFNPALWSGTLTG